MNGWGGRIFREGPRCSAVIEAQFKQFKKQCAAMSRGAACARRHCARGEEWRLWWCCHPRAGGRRTPHSSNEHGRSVLTLLPSTLARCHERNGRGSGDADTAPTLPIVGEGATGHLQDKPSHEHGQLRLESALCERLHVLADDISGAYRTFPLLCSRIRNFFGW